MAREPGAHRMRGLLALFELATRQRHPVVSFAQYLEFRADRLAGRVVRADADAEPPLGREPAAVDKLVVGRRFEVVVAGPQQAIEVPGRHASGLVLRQLVLNGFPLSPPAAEPCGWVQLPLPAGRHTLEIRYDEAPRP
jgi:hypothetical protein